MSDLTRFRDHCRDMAKADQNPQWSILADELDRWLAGELDENQPAPEPGLFG